MMSMRVRMVRMRVRVVRMRLRMARMRARIPMRAGMATMAKMREWQECGQEWENDKGRMTEPLYY